MGIVVLAVRKGSTLRAGMRRGATIFDRRCSNRYSRFHLVHFLWEVQRPHVELSEDNFWPPNFVVNSLARASAR